MVLNDNIVKLRELTDKICKGEVMDDSSYIEIIKQIKQIVDEEENNLSLIHGNAKKIKCYEDMCSKIKIILNKFKLT